jgi:hypothetical protein
MKLEALCSINNGQHNYDAGTDKGDIFEVSSKEGEALINAGAARKAASASKPTEPKQPEKLVDVQASNEGRAAKRQEAEKAAKAKKEKTAEKTAK